MTETRIYEPARQSTPVKPPKLLFSLKPLDGTNENRDFFLVSDFQQA